MPEPPIRQAIDFTQDTIVARAADYRNLVVILSLGICGLLITTLVTWNWMLLFVFCWLLPLVHGWLWIDARRIRLWRRRIIEICDAGRLDIEVFRSTISHLKHLPQSTLSGMLELLPSDRTASLAGEEERLGKQQSARQAERAYWINLIVSTLGCLFVMMGVFLNAWLLLAGLAICIGCARLSQWIVS